MAGARRWGAVARARWRARAVEGVRARTRERERAVRASRTWSVSADERAFTRGVRVVLARVWRWLRVRGLS